MSNSKQLIVIAGPTASGKSRLAIELAIKYQSAIINADSRQVYAEMQIGTARPTQEEMQAVPHYLFGHVSIHEEYHAASYAHEASRLLDSLFKSYSTLILCGGTGLYIQALLEGLDELPPADQQLRQELQEQLNTKGLDSLVDELQNRSPERAAQTDLKNPQRVIRALEILRQSGSSIKGSPKTEENAISRNWDVVGYYLNPDRDMLYNRINERVDEMLQAGLEDEARALYPFRDLKALQTVGYAELFKYFDGEWTREQAIDKIKQHTRNYAKRQLTWFRNKTEFSPIQDQEIFNLQ